MTDDGRDYRVEQAIMAHHRGWALTPLRGKVPVLDGWQRQPPPDVQQVQRWAEQGNVGLRTGPISGVFVVDLDESKGGALPDIPRTPTVLTGGGGRHLYFSAPDECPGNSASKLAPYVDTRGAGGQVVFVGSVHPQTGLVYQWAPGLSPDDVPLAELPADWLDRLTRQKPPDAAPTPAQNVLQFPVGDRYVQAALTAETCRVSSAAEGQRNETLNRAAYALGQLVGGGVVERSTVEAALEAAAASCGLPETEARRTIASGISSGLQCPRRPEPRAVTRPAEYPQGGPPTEDSAENLPEVLAPGAHVDRSGEYHEIGCDDFVEGVLASVPPGVIYRRSGVAGEIVGEPGAREFRPLTNARLRVIVDQHVRITAWKAKRADGAEQPVKIFVPCSRDHAAIVLDQAAIHPLVRDLRLLTVFPCFLGRDFQLIAPGWNPAHGAFYDEPPELAGLDCQIDLLTCYARLQDLVVDFPWRDDASRENFLGLVLTPLIRHALDGNVPMHLIISPLERTGKSKLAEEVFGGIILGPPTPALQLSGQDEERDKRITGLLLEGSSIVHIDNVREFLDSAALASLLTATTYSGRLLGRSEILRLPNNLTVVASGNNVRATGEIVKRTVPIGLQPKTDAPESRTDFRHPDLREYVREVRRDVLGALLSMVIAWRDGERVLHPDVMGGFERWSQVVGGVLITAGFGRWMDNARAWRLSANPEGEELRLFVGAWAERFGRGFVLPGALMALADELGLFSNALRASSEKARQASFGRQVLSRHMDSPVGLWLIRCHFQGNQRLFFLEAQT